MPGCYFGGSHWSNGKTTAQQNHVIMACSIMRKLESFQTPKKKRK